ncbi:MAG TPA: aldolase/citrate lyase family protein [Chloroflexota bacterium]
MRPNKVKQLWREGKPVAAGWCSTPDPYTAEVMVRAGFDAIVLDMQHGMGIGPDRAATWLQIIGQADVTPLVRIPWNEPTFAQWVLDAGAMGIIVPMVNSVEDARKAIGACRYPPVGYRSNGPNRARYVGGADYFSRANDEVICLLMMETIEAVDAIEEIAKLPGSDGFYIGPTDLAISMGLQPALDHKDPKHAAVVQKVVDTAKAHNLQAGIHVTGPEEAARRWKQGFSLSPVIMDMAALSTAAQNAISQFREGV